MKEVHLSESNFLLSAIQRGDQKAFDALFRRYYPALCAYGHRFVNLEDAEEIVQDSLYGFGRTEKICLSKPRLVRTSLK